MAAKAYYGVEALSYSDNGFNEFQNLLAIKIMHSPKRWNSVKYVYNDLDHDGSSEKRFVIIFNAIISQDELDEFLEPFGNMELTGLYGIEL